MKRYHIIYFAVALLAATFFAACSPEEYEGADENGLPTVEGVDFTVNVDQATNEVVIAAPSLPQGTYPIWYIDTNNDGTPDMYSTLPSLAKIYGAHGDYTAELHLGNRNGFSRAGVKKTFHVDNDLLDPALIKRLSGKQWRIDHAVEYHMACGEPGTDGTGWWHAAPDEKADMGVYDDRISFTAEGGYSYNPGEGGTVYVNKDAGVFNEFNPNNGADYMAKVDAMASSYKIEMDGDKRYLVLADKSLFPYISTGDQYANPRFRIEDLTAKTLVLVYDNGKIAWHFILTSSDDVVAPEGFAGYKYDSPCNLWKAMKYTTEFYYADTDSWTPNPDPIGFKDNGGGKYTISLPDASKNQWQAQVKFHTDMAANTANHYDFSAKFTATEDVKGATVKLVKDGDDGMFFFEERIDLVAGDTYNFYKDNLEGLDMEKVMLVLDFGGAPAGTQVELTDVVFKEHDCDDGAGHPEAQADNAAYPYDTPDNLWKTVEAKDVEMFYFYADANWAPYPEHQGFKHAGNTYTLSFPHATVAQWQNQVAFYTPLSCKAGDTFDFGCVMTPNNDLGNVTVKLVKHGEGNEGVFFFTQTVNLKADEDNVVKFPAQVAPADMESIDLFLDFGGNPENTEVVIKDIVLKKSAK